MLSHQLQTLNRYVLWQGQEYQISLHLRPIGFYRVSAVYSHLVSQQISFLLLINSTISPCVSSGSGLVHISNTDLTDKQSSDSLSSTTTEGEGRQKKRIDMSPHPVIPSSCPHTVTWTLVHLACRRVSHLRCFVITHHTTYDSYTEGRAQTTQNVLRNASTAWKLTLKYTKKTFNSNAKTHILLC